LIGLLASAAEQALADPGRQRRIASEARAAGYAGDLGKLKLVQFMVMRALTRRFGVSDDSNPPDEITYAQTYLYPYRERLGPDAERLLGIQHVYQALFG
jgi:hypothetical protein